MLDPFYNQAHTRVSQGISSFNQFLFVVSLLDQPRFPISMDL